MPHEWHYDTIPRLIKEKQLPIVFTSIHAHRWAGLVLLGASPQCDALWLSDPFLTNTLLLPVTSLDAVVSWIPSLRGISAPRKPRYFCSL